MDKYLSVNGTTSASAMVVASVSTTSTTTSTVATSPAVLSGDGNTMAGVWNVLKRECEKNERDLVYAYGGTESFTAIDDFYRNDARLCSGILLLRDNWCALFARLESSRASLCTVVRRIAHDTNFLVAILTLARANESPEQRAAYERLYSADSSIATASGDDFGNNGESCDDGDDYDEQQSCDGCDDEEEANDSYDRDAVEDNAYSENRRVTGKATRDSVTLLAATYENFYREFFDIVKRSTVCNVAGFQVSQRTRRVDLSALLRNSRPVECKPQTL